MIAMSALLPTALHPGERSIQRGLSSGPRRVATALSAGMALPKIRAENSGYWEVRYVGYGISRSAGVQRASAGPFFWREVIMKINRASGYAVQAVVYMATHADGQMVASHD